MPRRMSVALGTAKTLRRWFQESEQREELDLITKDCHPVIDRQNLFAQLLETALGALNVELNPEVVDFLDLNIQRGREI